LVDVAVLVSRCEDVRLIRDSDIPWVLDLGVKRYPLQYDRIGAEGWLRNCVLPTPLLFYPARTQNAFTISMLNIVPWLPNDIECNVVAMCADDGAMWEVARLLRASVAWAKKRRANTWRVVSETDFDVGPLARRMGAKEQQPRYIMRL
jgi:hypothetical protein